MTKKIPFLLAASALTSLHAHAIEDSQDDLSSIKKEQCYCIVQAGKNDCANSSGTHRCATYATKNADCGEWILLPAGTCQKILDASLEPKK